MYAVSLTESHFPAQADGEILPTTVGGILRDAAMEVPDATALTEARADGTIGRSWTYRELLADAERLAFALTTRFEPGERIVPPLGFASFPKEVATPPYEWVARVYDVRRWSEMRRGGHFAAMEQPAALAEDIRAFFRLLR